MKANLINKKHSEKFIIWAMCEYHKYIIRMENPNLLEKVTTREMSFSTSFSGDVHCGCEKGRFLKLLTSQEVKEVVVG